MFSNGAGRKGRQTDSPYLNLVAKRNLEVSAQLFCMQRSRILLTVTQPAMLEAKST